MTAVQVFNRNSSLIAVSLPRCSWSVQVVKVDHDFGTTFSGVLTDRCGRIRALWGSYAEQRGGDEVEFCAGIPTALWTPWLNKTLQAMNAAAAGTAAGQQQAGVQSSLQPAMHALKSNVSMQCRPCLVLAHAAEAAVKSGKPKHFAKWVC